MAQQEGGSPADPSGFVTDPPSTIVKIVNIGARPELNGQCGIVLSYSVDRSRYLVSVFSGSNDPIAFKPENLVRATFVEKTKAHFSMAKQQLSLLMNDPAVRERLRRAYATIDRRLPGPAKPEHLAVALCFLFVLSVYFLGFTKTILATSMITMVPLIAVQDVVAGADFQTIRRNFPGRCRENIESSVPLLRGKVSDRMALGAVLALLAMCGKVLVTPSRPAARFVAPPAVTPAAQTSPSAAGGRDMEEIYKLGYQDGKANADYGHSLPAHSLPGDLDTPRDLSSSSAARTTSTSSAIPMEDDYDPTIDYGTVPKTGMSKFGFGTMMSIVYLFNQSKTLGTTPEGSWDFRLFVANAKAMEPWKLGLVGLSLYRIVTALF